MFPLPLTPFEAYYWYDNQPEFPAAFPLELRFSGYLDRDAFTRAVAAVVERHPLLTALVTDAAGHPAWIAGDCTSFAVDWSDEDLPVSHPDGEWIDLRKSPGLRVWVRRQPAGSRVLFEFHHACCDGLAAKRVVEEILLTYHRFWTTGETIADLAPLVPERLRTRGNFGEAAPTFRTAARDWWIGLSHWAKLLMHAPAPLALPASNDNGTAPGSKLAHGQGSPTADRFLEILTHSWSVAEAVKLRSAASSLGGTLNDLFLRDLFLAMRDWNASHGRPRSERFRINMPASLGGKEDAQMPAANALSFAFLTHSARECDRPQDLFESVRRETESVKRHRLGLYFLGGLAVGSLVPGLVPRMLRMNRSFATVCLSNVGNTFTRAPLPRQDRALVCGNTVLRQVRAAPPYRRLTRASFVVINYAGACELNLRCDPRAFSPAQAQEFLATYVDRLQASASAAGAADRTHSTADLAPLETAR